MNITTVVEDADRRRARAIAADELETAYVTVLYEWLRERVKKRESVRFHTHAIKTHIIVCQTKHTHTIIINMRNATVRVITKAWESKDGEDLERKWFDLADPDCFDQILELVGP